MEKKEPIFGKVNAVSRQAKPEKEQVLMKPDIRGLAHTKWKCKYQIEFAPKYRRQIIYGKIEQDIGIMLRKLCA